MSAVTVFDRGRNRLARSRRARRPPRAPHLGFSRGSLGLGQVAGIDVTVSYTWPIFALVTFALTIGYLPGSLPGLSLVDFALLGCLSTLLLFGSLLVHELSHSLVARARGLKVGGIVLFVLGGFTRIEGELDDPMDELLVFLVGPLSSLALAATFLAIGRLPISEGPVLYLLPYLATINVIIAAVNLVPGLPLDGGRVLRAAVRRLTGSAHTATYWASIVGQVFAFALVVFAVVQLAGGSYLGGVWNLFIGWFLNGAAVSSRRTPLLGMVYLRARNVSPSIPLLPAPLPAPRDTTKPL